MGIRQTANCLQAAVADLRDVDHRALREIDDTIASLVALRAEVAQFGYGRNCADDRLADAMEAAARLFECDELADKARDLRPMEADPRDARKLCVVDQAGSGMGGGL